MTNITCSIQILTKHQLQHQNVEYFAETQDNFSLTREIVVKMDSESIVGRYPLFDLLSLSAASGGIAVTVIPQRADYQNPGNPAHLRIRTKSGSITVSFAVPETIFPSDNNFKLNINHHVEYCSVRQPFQFRPYEIDVETESGSISGQFIFSTSAQLSSDSGGISASLVPIIRLADHRGVSDDGNNNTQTYNASIVTSTNSGSPDIHLADPCFVNSPARFWHEYPNLQFLLAQARHITHDGSLNIAYPQAWAGHAHAHTGGGSIHFGGRNLNVTMNEDGSADGFKREGRKEWGEMNVPLESGAGAILFCVG